MRLRADDGMRRRGGEDERSERKLRLTKTLQIEVSVVQDEEADDMTSGHLSSCCEIAARKTATSWRKNWNGRARSSFRVPQNEVKRRGSILNG